MTTEPVVVGPETTVAEALARVRDPVVAPVLAGQVFVAEAPTTTPTGRYLGAVGIQRLLREPPSMAVGRCVEDRSAIDAGLAEREVAERLAAYDLLAVAVVDADGRLVGAVTVDDVLDAALPAGWRQRR